MVLTVVALLLGLPGAVGDGAPAALADADDLGDAAKAAKNGPRGYFEPNLGQFPAHVRFVVHGAGTHAFLTDEGATFVLAEPVPEPGLQTDLFGDPFLDHLPDFTPSEPEPASLLAVQIRFEDADPGAMEGTERRLGVTHQFIGNDPDKWVTDVPHYGRVVQRDVWPGIDIEWHIAPEGLKFDAVVQPGAEPKLVRFTLPGADTIALDAKGDLRIATPFGELVKEAPFTYQETAEGVQEIPSRYVLEGGTVGFDIDDHDPLKTLVIDPLIYSTYFTSGSGNTRGGHSVAVDTDGHAYVTGAIRSPGWAFPAAGGISHGDQLGSDVIPVFKLTPAGDEVVFNVRLGSSGGDLAHGIAVDAARNVYITGYTQGNNFPTTPQNALQPNRNGGSHDAFVTKLRPDGGQLLYSTYLGGPGTDFAKGIAVDDEGGGGYVTGGTTSPNWLGFPTTPGSVQPIYTGGQEVNTFGGAVFLVKLNTTAGGDDSLVYGTYLGGSPERGARPGEWGEAVAVDGEGHAYVTGYSDRGAIRTTSTAFQPTSTGGTSFVAKFTPGGDGLVYSTYLDGSDTELGYGIASDETGHAYVTGITHSSDFPTSRNAVTEFDSYRDTKGSSAEVFLTKLRPDGTGLVYSTFVSPTAVIGGSGPTHFGPGVAVDGQGQAFVAGWTPSNGFEARNAFQDERAGGTDAFVAAFQSDGSDLVWGTYFGGTGTDLAREVAVDSAGSVYITGHTASSDFPTRQAVQPSTGGGGAGFVAKLYGVTADFDWSPDPPCPGDAVRFRDLSVSLSGATGAAGSLAQSQWELGDGSNAITLSPWQNGVTHTYPPQASFEDRSYNVTLTVADAFGASASLTRVVEVPWCPPPNHAPSLKALPCIVASPDQRLSFHVHASVPVFPDDPPSYSTLTFSAEGLPSGATFQQDGDFSARFMWDVGPPDMYTFVVHVADGGLPNPVVASLSDSKEYCVEVRPEKTVPGRIDSSGDGVQNWHDACPHMKNPDQGDAAGGGLDDPCNPVAPPEPEEAPAEEGPPPGGCPSQPAGPREVTARWTDDAVQITWQSDSWCPPDHFLVWNGTGHHLVDFIVAEAGVHYVVLNTDPWPEPHQYFVQAMGADEGLFFDPTRAVASNLIDPAGCVAEGARSEACLPLKIAVNPPAAVEPAAPEAAPPADGAPVGLIAGAVALVVGGLTALLWRLRHAPWIVHLFSRLERGADTLEHPLRKKINAVVKAEPGIHSKEIQRRSGAGEGATRRHLQSMVYAGIIVSRKTAGYLCYYPANGIDDGVQEVGGLLRTDMAKRLLGLVVEEPGLGAKEMGKRLQARPSAVRYHLRRLEGGSLVRLQRHEFLGDLAYPGELAKDALAALADSSKPQE